MPNPLPNTPFASSPFPRTVATVTEPAASPLSRPAPAPGLRGLDAYVVALDFYRLIFQATKGRVQNEHHPAVPVRSKQSAGLSPPLNR